MNEGTFFEYQEEIDPQDGRALFEGIIEEAYAKKKMERMRPFGIFLKDSSQQVLGGVTCLAYYGCLYIDQLWIKECERGKHTGLKLMQEAEKTGKRLNCSFATVNTMDWEALAFYEKMGYSIEFIREGYDRDSKMFLLRKPL